RLSNAGEFLALVSPAGDVASAFTPTFPPQRDDVSFGRVEGAPNVTGYFTTPTPGKPNSQSGPGFAPGVLFSTTGRPYVGSLDLTLALALATNAPAPPGTVLRFTLDGSLPTESSAAYTVPLRFTNAAVQVRARAFAPGLLPGEPRSETFIALTPGVASFRSDLPVLLIHNFNQGRPPANAPQPAQIQVFEPATNGLTSLATPPALATRATIRARGSSTEGYPKVSLRVEFQDEFGNDLDRPFLGLPPEADWVLYAPNNFEPALIHNPYMHQLSRDLGRYSPRTRFCEVYLVTSGTNAVSTTTYNGIYVLMERIEIGGDRVDASNLTPDDLTSPRLTGGYMMKIDRLDPGDGGLSAGGLTVGLVEPRESELELPARAPQLNYLRNYLNSFAAALNGPSYRDPAVGYRAWVNIDSWIDHHLLNVLAFNVDALRLSAYFHKPRNGRLEFGPLWDFDRALGSNDGRDANPRVWRSTIPDFGTDFFNFPWWGRMFTDPDFHQRYIDRYHELRRAQFSTTNLWRLADALSGQVRQAHPRELSRWGVQPRGGSYTAEIARMKTWLSNRVSFMDSQFVAPPTPGTPGGTVPRGHLFTLSAPTNVALWYTLDGSDPRLPGGAVSGAARAYTAPLIIRTNTRVAFRGRNPGHTALTGANNPPLASIWSGLQVLPLITDPLPVVISEIQFDPAGRVDFDPDDFEFVELLNRGSGPVNLAGCQVDGGIRFTFAATNGVTRLDPGARLVLVENPAAFRSRHPLVTNVAGPYEGRLNNAGDRLRLVGPLGETVVEVDYSPA
ncbi:MAG: CotH kinase family protein, partial [Verrucomicrobiota bacterium]